MFFSAPYHKLFKKPSNFLNEHQIIAKNPVAMNNWQKKYILNLIKILTLKTTAMSKVKKILFPATPSPLLASTLLLAARIMIGLPFLSHGIAKWAAFESLALEFPDPLGVGSTISLLLVIFAEVVCSICFILGAAYRLCLVPMIFTMATAFFVIHADDTFAHRELSLIYLIIFILMYIAGPGYFSLDSAMRRIYGLPTR